MFFKKIRLKNFRNFDDFSTDFSTRVNFFIGDNGQGKTNLVEAICLLTSGDSFRFTDNSVLIKNQREGALLQGFIQNKNLDYEIDLQILKSKKNFLVNNKKSNGSEIRKKFHAVTFSPESLSSIKEGAEERRDLVDDLISSVFADKQDLRIRYRHALKTRNRILKNHLEGIESFSVTKALIESLQPQFLELAAELTFSRTQALKAIQDDFNNAMQYISGQRAVDISVEYVASGENRIENSKEEVAKMLQKRAEELMSSEMAAGTSLVGPHKHEIQFLYGQKDSRFFCSQGQQRAIILSFKMAQIVYHRKVHETYPILLLDDVLSELDVKKKTALISFLHEINSQTFITTTDLQLPESFRMEDVRVIQLKNGKQEFECVM